MDGDLDQFMNAYLQQTAAPVSYTHLFNHTVMEPYDVACEIERRRVENAIMINILEGNVWQ